MDATTDTGQDICEKNEDTIATSTRDIFLNISIYYYTINIIILLKYPKRKYWQCKGSWFFILLKKTKLTINHTSIFLFLYRQRGKEIMVVIAGHGSI